MIIIITIGWEFCNIGMSGFLYQINVFIILNKQNKYTNWTKYYSRYAYLQVNSLEQFQSLSNIPLIEICNQRSLCNCSRQLQIPGQLRFYFLQFMDGLSSVTKNARCSAGILSLFCDIIASYDNSDTIPTTIASCIDVRDNKCTSEWRIIEAFLNTSLLDCSNFNDSKAASFSRAPPLDCPDDFGVSCGSLCQPACADISLFSDAATTAYRILSIVCYCICITGGVINLFACYFHRSKMWV